MRALLFDGQLHLRTDYPDPVPMPGESIVKVSLAGICGTDLEITRGYMEYAASLAMSSSAASCNRKMPP